MRGGLERDTPTGREFNHDVGRANRAARHGPRFITDRGPPAHVLLSIDDDRRLTGSGPSAAEALADPEAAAVDFEPARADDLARAADLGRPPGSAARPPAVAVYLLDTNVLSKRRKVRSRRADPRVAAWAEQVPLAELFVSVISLQEIEIGVLLVERRDADQAAGLRRWYETTVLPAFAERALGVDVAVARRSAALNVPDPRPVRDALIAATALVHGLVMATRDDGDCVPLGVQVLNPWSFTA